MTVSESPLQVLAGQRQKYHIDASAPLAYGRLSVLFKGTSDDGGAVCVKLFRDRLSTVDGDVDFSRELQILRTLRHPSILPVLDFGATTEGQSRPFLVLPFCEQGNLRSLLETRSFLPVDLALNYLRDIAGALDHSHKAGVIHGDLKPENILIADDSRAYLADFGAARYRLRGWKTPTTAREATGPFTEFYASPEQIESGTQSIRSDVYSFAMIAYELLTGKPPIDETAPAFQRMLAKIQGRIIDPFDANPALPQPVGEALLRGLSKEAKDRPLSAGELVLLIEQGFVMRGMVSPVAPTTTREVFVVHGRDDSSKEKIARFLDRIGLRAIVLHEMASAGRTIIEKIEAYSDVAAAVVLLTADDVGALSSQRERLRPRARQNVIFELGYFAAKLGRNKTIALHGGVELPSDISGVIYIPLDSGGAWRFDLIRELRAAGLTVDANAAFD